MFNVLRFTSKTFLWILYCMLTLKERQMYQHSIYRQREVLDVENDAFGSTYHMGKRLKENEQPIRDYLTWKEFRKQHKF